MAGYYGFKMSNNAKQCYDDGIKPLSRWRKSDFVDEVYFELDVKVKSIKGSYKNYLKLDSWHHTGKYYQQTDFYAVDIDRVEHGIKNGDIIVEGSEGI